ncbi:GNAT family N-acetyltransferase [Vibrio pelagius]|uniref:tRNA(Met) cytidine acetyltransferase TmcA n=1 Tax=Vibrio pelagius TaxID=28169 RepID=A0ABY5G9V5_VIBPE|nr:GNAT family N-acetyltransferase [Vibrio pelagius]UTT86486.1 GNAT family N-acetyltransferase [Vibrio pelagius]
MTTLPFLTQLSTVALNNNHRYGVLLEGDQAWQSQQLESYLFHFDCPIAFVLGGLSVPNAKNIAFNKGQQLLGQECQVLICDFSSGFDANSFTAALGALVGGGGLFVIPPANHETTLSQVWLTRQLDKLICLSQSALSQDSEMPALPEMIVTPNGFDKYEQQKLAIEAIEKVMFGHRKRPLVLTADRGRGKSSALGIASANIIKAKKSVTILVTAPNVKAIQPLFDHAQKLLPNSSMENRHTLVHEQSKIVFVAPDELLRTQPACDLLFVDEAAAIPLPMLKRMVESYHRMVFSTTVHGYEGSGRGFGIKFEKWLSEHRPNWRSFKLEQPIRWNENDPLESWLFDTFLLDSDIEALPKDVELDGLSWHQFDKQTLLSNPKILAHCFGLLVSAHYQTSPNDLTQLLDNPQMSLYALFSDQDCLGCILTAEEGGLSHELIQDVQLGKRRPRGHLAPTLLANHLGLDKAATQKSLRVMRIAVHPDIQGRGLGHRMIGLLVEANRHFDYIATSFGATSELVDFWTSNDFFPLHLGHQRDQSSGCHSLLMCRALNEQSRHWVEEGNLYFNSSLRYLLSTTYRSLELAIVRSLISSQPRPNVVADINPLLGYYVDGGNSFDSIGFMLENLIYSLDKVQLDRTSDLLLWKVVQKRTWTECSELANLAGRKQTESAVRRDLGLLLSSLQCK